MKKLIYILPLLFLTQIIFGQIKTIKVQGGGGNSKTDTALISKIVHDSLTTINLDGYTKAQVDSISTRIRSEITAASGGGVTSFNSRTGPISPQSTDYSAFYKDINYVPTWSEVTSKPSFATVSTSGSYTDLSNKPTIPTIPANVSAFTNDAAYLKAADISGKLDKSDSIIANRVTNLQTNKTDKTTTINSKPLSSNVVISATDINTGTLPHAQLPILLSTDIPDNTANTTGNAATVTNGVYTTTFNGLGDARYYPLSGNPSSFLIASNIAGKANLDNPIFTTRITTPAITLGATTITATGVQINYLVGVTSAIQTQFTAKANLASPTFTGTPLSTTPIPGDNTTKIATTSFVGTAITNSLSSYLTTANAESTYEPKITTKNTAFNKNFDIIPGSVVDGQRFIDSVSAINARISKKRDTAYSDTTLMRYPLQVIKTPGAKDSIVVSQTYLDSITTLISTTRMANLSARDYANDSLAVTVGGLSLWDYYRTGNVVKVVVNVPPANVPNWTINNSSGTANSYTFNISNYGSPNFTLNVDWGDGTNTNYTSLSSYSPAHTYTTGVYIVKLTISDNSVIKTIEPNKTGNDVDFQSFVNINMLSGLDVFKAISNKHTNIDSIIYPANLKEITMYGGYFTSFNPIAALPSGLRSIDFSQGALTSFAPSVGLPATINSIDISGQGWSSAQVNATLAYLVTKTFNAGAKTLSITQTPAAPPTGQGVTDVATLTSNGWTVTHD
jgi:hypothetical protein